MDVVPIKSTVFFDIQSPAILNDEEFDLTESGVTMSCIIQNSAGVETELTAVLSGSEWLAAVAVTQFTCRAFWKRRWRYRKNTTDIRSRDWTQFKTE